jgi:hypothetical protein
MGTKIISQDTNNLVCDAAGCYREASTQIVVQLKDKKIRILNLCERCRNNFFPNCRYKSDVNTKPTLIDDKDVPLDFNTKTKCTCLNCDNEANTFLEMVSLPNSGYYCESCAIDIKLHGIAEEMFIE